MKSPSAAVVAREVLRDYLAFYRTNWAEGKLGACNEAALKSRARRLQAAELESPGKWDVSAIAEGCWKMQGKRGGGAVLRKLIQAFGYLELLCVNLFLSPWRKEIKSLKTFTGNFVYYIKSVLPQIVAEQLLAEIGYVATSPTEFSLVRKRNEEEAEQTAFQIFLARIECEDLLEISGDVRDSDLADILQKRSSKHGFLYANPDKKQEGPQRNEYAMAGEKKGPSNLGITYLSRSQFSLEAKGGVEQGSQLGLQCPEREIQAAATKWAPEQDMNQSQKEGISGHGVKSSDSEDFLLQYSDIAIGQKPLRFPSPPSKASNEESWLTEARLGAPISGAQAFAHLPSDESGPQHLALLIDSALVGRTPCDHRGQEACQEIIESKLHDAMASLSLHGSNSTDHPKELKGNVAPQMADSSRDLAPTLDKKPNKEDCRERLMYPVQKTAHSESARSQRASEELYHSRIKFANLPRNNMDLYSADLSSDTAGCECPMAGSRYGRRLEAVPVVCEAEGCLKHIGIPPSSCPVPSEVQHSGGLSTSIPYRKERCPVHTSLADFPTCVVNMSETSPEGYVIINKDD